MRQLFAASFGRKPYGAATAAHGTPVTGRLRSPPYPAAAPASTTTSGQSRTRCADRREDVTATGPERRALSGLASPASTMLRIPLRGTRLRRAVDPGDLCQPSGPDGEGQARGEARKARGEPPKINNKGDTKGGQAAENFGCLGSDILLLRRTPVNVVDS